MAYATLAADGNTDASGITTFTNRPANAEGLVQLDQNNKPEPVAEAALNNPGDPGTSYTAGDGIDITNGVISAPVPERLDPLTYPVMVSVGGNYVGYDSLEDAVAVPGNANKAIVLNAQLVFVATSITLTGHLYSVSYAAILLETGITLTLKAGIRLTNINIYRNNASTARVMIGNANTGGAVPAATQAVQLVDSRIGTNLVFSDASQAVAARGRSVVEFAEGQPGTVYLYDLATVTGLGTVRPAVIDRKPGVEVRSGNTVTLDRNSAYTPLTSGTFTVDLSTKVVGAEAVVYLEPGTTDPALPSSDFQRLYGAYQSGASLMYTLKVGANGKVQYVINLLP